VDARLLDDWVTDPALAVFEPERRDPEMTYVALCCGCGGHIFRLAGWPRLATGRGGFFWRTIARVWREARMPMEAGEPLESPFLLPLDVQCDRCDRRATVFDAPGVAGWLAPAERRQPRESYRCRACRRGRVELVAGLAVDVSEGPARACAFELVARCHACHRQARVAWADARPNPQQVRLDLLYGRR
jgi:hypothetical protein